jgi:hypothetical protein
MTSQSPRIYIYKITFEEVPYYYYGVKKEKKYNECYMGSPVTHKWCWDFYTPKKQILQLFDFTDEGWIEAQEVEKRLIRPFYNTDKWCLNESCGGKFSIFSLKSGYTKNKINKTGICSLGKEELSFYGSVGGNKNKENRTGFFSLSFEERQEIGKKNGKLGGKKSAEKNKENKTGFWNSQLQSELGKKGGTKTKELGVGIFGISPEDKSKLSREIGLRMRDNKKGIFSLTKEQLSKNSLKNKEKKIGIFSLTKEEKSLLGKINGTNTGKQKWMCLETGHISTPGPLTNYQRARNIDTSKRKRVD